MAEEDHHVRSEGLPLFRRGGSPRPRLAETRRRERIAALGGITPVEAVVRQPATDVMERLMTLSERIEQIVQAVDLDISRAGKAIDPCVEDVGLMHVEHAIWTECGIDPGFESTGSDSFVMRERLGWIVRGAYGLDAEFSQNPVRAQLRRPECRVRALPDCTGARWVQQFVHVEVALQLEMSPVVERTA